MDASEYIDAVIGQMRCRRAHAMVAKELSDHISDQTETFLHQGMSAQQASARAVLEMGDAVEVGMEMDRLHRPAMDRKTLIAVGILSLAAMFLQIMITQMVQMTAKQGSSVMMIPFQILLGLLVMTGILFIDYTFLGKHPIAVWAILLLLPLILKAAKGDAVYVSGNPGRQFVMYLLMGLFLPAWAGIIYHYRGKGWLGLLKSVLWLLAGFLCYLRSDGGFFILLTAAFSCVLLLSFALAKGWYGIPKGTSLAVLWGVCIGAGALLLTWLYFYRGYAFERLKVFFDFADRNGSNYLTANMRDTIENFAIWGQGQSWDGKPVEGAMSFFLILNRMGILPGILILLLLGVLFVCMGLGVSKQKNVLGSLLGLACMLGLILPIVGHLLNCLALIPFTDILSPFLSPGWMINIATYTLLGLYLSVYRYKDVVA